MTTDDRIVAVLLASGRRIVPDCECAGLSLLPNELVVCDVCGGPWRVEGEQYDDHD